MQWDGPELKEVVDGALRQLPCRGRGVLLSRDWGRNGIEGIHQLHQELVSILLALPAEHAPCPKRQRVVAPCDDKLAPFDIRGQHRFALRAQSLEGRACLPPAQHVGS